MGGYWSGMGGYWGGIGWVVLGVIGVGVVLG